MARLGWYKDKIDNGDIITFIYKGIRRNIIVMESPNDPGRYGKFITKEGLTRKFLHGLELPYGDQYKSLIRNLVKEMGGTRILFENGRDTYYQINFGSEMKDIMNARAAYSKIKKYVDRYGLYKTYHWQKIKRVSLINNVTNLEKLINPRYKDE